MEQLYSKYRNNELTPEELIELREKIDASTDQELEIIMSKEWNTENINDSNIDSVRLEHLKQKIDSQIPLQHPRFSLSMKGIGQIAATILIPILLISTFYLYQENRVLASEEMVIATGKGERANITLPDGTKVYINSESTLQYTPVTYNRKERKLNFEGEAYFDVQHNTSVPFSILTNDVKIKVLGTKFNLQARKEEVDVEVFLEEGHVMLSSILSQQQQELFPNQKAILDKVSGKFTVIKTTPQQALAWKQSELIFQKVTLRKVIETIEKNYEIDIRLSQCDTIGNDLFSGTLPSENLSEALYILQKSYHFTYSISDNIVTFSCK